jgi:rhomboid family GlyGly-CTERM serine protease
VIGAARAWVLFALALAAAALLPWRAVEATVDWQPALAFSQPWRALSAALLHYSTLHLAANLAGALLVAAFGAAGGVPARMAWAWLAAWPLTQFGLLAQPGLAHFGGLSGVLHAGVAIAALFLAVQGAARQRWIGIAVLLGLAAKVLSEEPWGAPLRHPAGWDIAVAPAAHASGLVAGLLCGALALAIARRRPIAAVRLP